MNIVLIEDESITGQWMQKKLEELDSENRILGVFPNGKRALAYLTEQPDEPDLIFTDIRMPVMDGLEFLEQYQKLGRLSYIVILSAYDEFQYARRAMKLGAREFVLKPEITQQTLRRILLDADVWLAAQRVGREGLSRQEREEALRSVIMNDEEIGESLACIMERILSRGIPVQPQREAAMTSLKDPLPSGIPNYSPPVLDAMQYVEAHFAERITLDEIAGAVYLSKAYFSTLFHRETGQKFSVYLQEVRLEKARDMLLKSRKSMQEIADQTGFFDAPHFSRSFKEKFGVSPLEYRKAGCP